MQLIKTLETEEEITSNPEEMSEKNFKTQTVGKKRLNRISKNCKTIIKGIK